MSSRKEHLQVREQIIDYYLNVAKRCRKTTVRHFKSKVKSIRVIYRTIKVYEDRGNVQFAKSSICRKKVCTGENFRRYQELYRMDPSITHSEASEILGISKSSIHALQKRLNAELIKKSSSEPEMEGHFQNEENNFDDITAIMNSPDPEELKPKLLEKKASQTEEIIKKKRCLVCLQSFQRRRNHQNSVLQDSMTVMFALKMVLDLTSEDLGDIMKASNGRNPEDWTSFCGICVDLVKKAIDIRFKIRKLEEEWTECKREILDGIRKSSGARFQGICKREKLSVEKRVRKVVKERRNAGTFPQLNPFQEGDEDAKSKLLQLQIPQCTETLVKQEVVQGEAEIPEIADDFDVDGGDSMDDDPVPLLPPESETGTGVSSSNNDNGNEGGIVDTPVPILGVCDLCGVQIRPLAIPMHKLKEHGVVMEGYSVKKCTFKGCKYETLYEARYRDHRNRHNLPRSYSCQYCGKDFTTKIYLVRHEEIHKNAGLGPYQCEICGASFAVKTYLYLHTRLSHQGRYFPSTKRNKRS